jgi:hypothetical protein
MRNGLSAGTLAGWKASKLQEMKACERTAGGRGRTNVREYDCTRVRSKCGMQNTQKVAECGIDRAPAGEHAGRPLQSKGVRMYVGTRLQAEKRRAVSRDERLERMKEEEYEDSNGRGVRSYRRSVVCSSVQCAECGDLTDLRTT